MFSGRYFKSYLHLHFLVLIWGFTAIAGLRVSVSPIALVFYRTFFAALGLWILIFFQKKNLRIEKRDFYKMLGVGFLLSAHWILFFASARASTVSVCLAGMATTSLWTSLIEPLVNRRSIRLLEVALGILAFAGLYVVFRFEFNHAFGLLLALASAFLAASFTVANSRLVQRNDAFVITFYEMVGASTFSLLFLVGSKQTSLVTSLPVWPDRGDWVWILFLALVCTVYASSMATQLMRKFSAYLVNLTINLEPVYGIALAFFFLGEKERMTNGFYLGTAVILATVLLYPFLNQLSLQREKSDL